MIEIAWAEFETYVLNNPTIVFLNQRGIEGEKLSLKKYSTRELRLQLVRVWGKRCMQHYWAKKRKRDKQDFEKRKKQVSYFALHLVKIRGFYLFFDSFRTRGVTLILGGNIRFPPSKRVTPLVLDCPKNVYLSVCHLLYENESAPCID